MVTSATIGSVGRFYTAFPFPQYPLLARPVWVESNGISSLFCGMLARTKAITPAVSGPVVIIGAGEMQPLVARNWEPPDREIVCIDLSVRSLRRARFRLGMRSKNVTLRHGAMEELLPKFSPGSIRHIECYGVLHHLARPTEGIDLIGKSLAPGGTARIMVYNAIARRFLHESQALLRVVGFDVYDKRDLRGARNLLFWLGTRVESLGRRLSQMGITALRNDAQFADAFFHPREARLPLTHWLKALDKAGLTVLGMHDRYGELDDLFNPLWRMPTPDELDSRALDGRFENNYELYVAKKSGGKRQPEPIGIPARLRLSRPPRRWFDFNETRNVSRKEQKQIWLAYLSTLFDGEGEKLPHLPVATLGRLARLGAIFPCQLRGAEVQKIGAPLADFMEPIPNACRPSSQTWHEIERRLVAELKHRDRANEERTRVAMERVRRIANL